MSSRFRLRYQAIDFPLGATEFIAGRTADCDLVLDDTLVSRRHASFRAGDTGLEVKDLGSRNGVAVNGARIQGVALLQQGDRVRIGSQELVVVDASEAKRETGTAELIRCRNCGDFIEHGTACPNCAAAKPRTGPVPVVGQTAPHAQLGSTLLADKALTLGRYEEAERLLTGTLAVMLAGAAGTSGSDAKDALKRAAGYALKLAEGLHKPSWLDYPFELHAGARVLMSAELIEELYRVVIRLRYMNPHAVHRYLGVLRAASSDWGASERFLLQRLEGLERRIVSG